MRGDKNPARLQKEMKKGKVAGAKDLNSNRSGLSDGIEMIHSSILPFNGLGFIFEIFLLLILLVVGIVVIIIIAKVLLFILPAAIVAVVVYFLTGYQLFWAGVAFLAVAFLSILKRK